jgi:hypothetical protein
MRLGRRNADKRRRGAASHIIILAIYKTVARVPGGRLCQKGPQVSII